MRQLIEAVVQIALFGCLLGFSLPWLSAVLARRGLQAGLGDPATTVWLIDLAAHWQLLFALLWIVLLAAWCFIGDSPRWQWLPLLALPGLIWISASPSLPAAPEGGKQPGSAGLRIAVANVHVSNRDPGRLVSWLRQHPSDVLVVPELNPVYAEALAAALPDMPHHSLYPRADSAFGIGLYARAPLQDVVLAEDADGIPALGATLDLDGRPVRVIALHPMPPLAPRWHAARDRLLHALAGATHPALGPHTGLPQVLAGDLNATPWSSALHLAADGGLRRATGLRGTWPVRWGGYMGIPIDHVLGSAEWQVVSTRQGPDIGSDHAPIHVELRLASPPQ